MTGIVGGTVDGSQLSRMIEAMPGEPWYGSERFEAGAYGLGMEHHGEKDPLGYTFWRDGRTAGAVDGAFTNLDELGWDVPSVFERLLRAPERTLAALEGPFTVACLDAADDRLLLGTDKIGSRPPYYTTDAGFHFGSGLAPLLTVLDDPAVDVQGVGDLLLMGHMWSDTTIVSGVRSLHPATLVEFRDGELTERRYWRPDYRPSRPTDAYFHELTNAYQGAVDRASRSLSGDVGVWLSGGLDSRATLAELARNHRDGAGFDSLSTFTYDSNPSGVVNPRLASDVARALELPNETVPMTPDRFLDNLERSVDLTDGMVTWATFRNLSSVFDIDGSDPDVMLEGIVGELVGQHLSRYHLGKASSLVESMYHSEASLDAEEVTALLDVDVDPLGSYRREARRIDEDSFEEAVVDAHYQNYYPRLAHASNPVPRSQVGTRVPYADGDLLSVAAKLPTGWRMGSLPFSDGELIYGVVKPKIRMMRALDADLADIPYERSRLKPSYPYPLHVVGFFASTALAQLRSKPTYGGRSLVGEWYRSHDRFRERIDGLVDDACDRPIFDADAVRTYQQRQQRDEADEMDALSSITTLELWLQRHLD
ncbi:MAG TPA: asparagine synthase-related protein [Halobacteriales archaeon]|nr:asparagine synthase-related protein [Halobacteriales archaeon]